MKINFKKMLATTLILSTSFLSTQAFAASHSEETTKVGVLHSLSGMMAICETAPPHFYMMFCIVSFPCSKTRGVCFSNSFILPKPM